jgi:hypothetical protein
MISHGREDASYEAENGVTRFIFGAIGTAAALWFLCVTHRWRVDLS